MGQTRFITRVVRRLADESGISLVVAVMSLMVLSIVTGSVAVYTTSNTRASVTDRSSASAYHLAEAGLNQAISRLSASTNPTDTAQLPPTTVSYPDLGGTVTYSGTGSEVNNRMVWSIRSTGTVTVAGVSGARSKTLTQGVVVRGLVPGADLGSWSRFYQDDTNTCLTIDTVNMPAPIATRGCLKVINGGSITGSSIAIEVGKTVKITGPSTATGVKVPNTASGTSWTNATNAKNSDNLYATYNIASRGTSNTLNLTNFSVGIPSNAIVLGVLVNVERKASASGDIQMQTIKLIKGGSIVGTDQTSSFGEPYFPSSDGTDNWGGSTNLWGTTLTAADVNASNFGVSI